MLIDEEKEVERQEVSVKSSESTDDQLEARNEAELLML
jgi:hypothetical protein